MSSPVPVLPPRIPVHLHQIPVQPPRIPVHLHQIPVQPPRIPVQPPQNLSPLCGSTREYFERGGDVAETGERHAAAGW